MSVSFIRTAVNIPCRHLGVLVAVMFFVATLSASVHAQIVRGQVVDSITGIPIGGGAVTLLDGAGSEVGRTITDPQGLFLLRASLPGEYRLRADVEGYRVSEFPAFELAPDQVVAYMLLVPSLNMEPPSTEDLDPDAIVSSVCPEETPDDVPVIVGVVRDAATNEPVDQAEVHLSWPSVPSMLSGRVQLEDTEGWAITGPTGFYAVCGAPPDGRIVMYAGHGTRISEVVSLSFEWGGGSRGIVTRGAYHSLPGRLWQQDFTLRAPEQRTASVVGSVADTAGMALADATVRIVGTPFSTRSDVGGSFRLFGLPPGTMRISAEHLGYETAARDVEVPEGETVDVDPLRLADVATELEPVTVLGEEPTSRRDLSEFERRRETTAGSFITREEFEQQGHVDETIDVLRRMRGIYILPGSGFPEWIILTRRGSMRGGLRNPARGEFCYPIVFLDRSYIGTTATLDVNRGIPVTGIEAIEVYASAAGVPQEFNRPGSVCGVIVFWTR